MQADTCGAPSRRFRYGQRIPRSFLRKERLNVSHNSLDMSRDVPEQVRRPDTMKRPALTLENVGSKNIPCDWVISRAIAARITQDSDGHVLNLSRVMQSEIDAETIISPVNGATRTVVCRYMRRKRLCKPGW